MVLEPKVLNMLDYDADHYCPVYNRIIDSDLCINSMYCLMGLFKISSTEELSEICDIERARKVCWECEYSD